PEARRVAVAFLGCAGVGYEAVIAAQVPSSDERGGREALRALSRIGSSKAAAMLADQIETGPAWIAIAAEEAMWRMPPALGLETARELLGRRRFVLRHPDRAARLLAHTAQTKNQELNPLLENLVSLRYHFWNPPVARIGMKARALLQ